MAQAESISTAIRELMSRGRPPKFTSPVRAAQIEFLAALAANPPHSIYVDADSEDIEARGDHVEKVLAEARAYLATILSDTASNIPGGLDHKYFDRLLSDFTDDAVGGIRNAAEQMAEHETWRAA